MWGRGCEGGTSITITRQTFIIWYQLEDNLLTFRLNAPVIIRVKVEMSTSYLLSSKAFGSSLVPRPLPRKAERGSGVLSDISCHMGRLRRK